MEFLLWFVGAGTAFYLASSVYESWFHENILDVTPARRALFYRLRGVLPMLWFGHLDHATLHHYRTYRRSYVSQFSDPGEEAALQRALAHQYPAPVVAERVKGRYGATFTWIGVPLYGLPMMANFLWLPLTPSAPAFAAVLLANVLFSTPYLAYSKWVHPYLHMRFDEAVATAPPPLRWFLRSPYGVAIRISHFIHHRHANRNYNLQYFGDLIRRRWIAPTAAEWEEMLTIGLVTPAHRQRFQGRRFLLHPF